MAGCELESVVKPRVALVPQHAAAVAMLRSHLSCRIALLTFFLLWPCGSYAQRQVIDREGAYRAVEYCRRASSRPVALSADPDTSAYHHVGWTLHPRYFVRLIKTRIEAYPEGQAEIDDMVSRMHRDLRVIYDP
jgi:hypothetical protein